jgi:hypothetical protein
VRCPGACSSRRPVRPPTYAWYGRPRARGPGRDNPRGGHSPGPPPVPADTPALPADPDRAARASIPPPVPVKAGARPPGHARQSGDVRPVTGGLVERQPWRGAGCFPRALFPADWQARYRPGAHRAGPPGRWRGGGFDRAGAGHGQSPRQRRRRPGRPGGRRVPVPAGLAWSRVAGRGVTGHGSASRSTCRPGWSSRERGARVGSGGVYAGSCPAVA